MLSTIEEHFAAITDERQQYKVRYPLLDILLITLVGVIVALMAGKLLDLNTYLGI
tara:strand:- start:32885 stop:33049 length:165 start_codon:yes stop_codon:yes gene_type:complete